MLLYDLTSTYFESDPPENPADMRRLGYSRDKRSDCVQVVIALLVTPEGFPLAYEVLPGNTTDKTTLKDFLGKIEDQYGKARRIWVMDRGIPTEETLQLMRQSEPPVSYLVGTPKGKLTTLEAALIKREWKQARPSVRVKLLDQEGETHVLAESRDRIAKERSMRRRRLRAYIDRLADIKARKRPMKRDALHQTLGAAKKDAGRDARFVKTEVQLHGAGDKQSATISWQLDRAALRVAWRREGRYLLRTNLRESDPAKLWEFYLQLTEVEQAFKELKGDLAIRPIHHQLERRIESHMLIQSPPHGSFTPAGLLLRRSLSQPLPRGIGSSRSSPAACKSPSKPGSDKAPPASPQEPSWRSSPPCRCSTCICPPPTDARSSWRATRTRRKSCNCCSTS